MARATEALVGGPMDGAGIAAACGRGAFVWVGSRDTPHSRIVPGFKEPAPGRLLYRWDGKAWVYAGHNHALCESCGGYNRVTDRHRCQLCGGSLTRL